MYSPTDEVFLRDAINLSTLSMDSHFALTASGFVLVQMKVAIGGNNAGYVVLCRTPVR